MRPNPLRATESTTEEPGLVSGRFLSDLFRSLERNGVPARQMLGDLPIPIDETGALTRSVEWADFDAFMKRLEHHVGGPEELEACGECIADLKPAGLLKTVAGFSASPYSLYRAASQWALRRAIPGVETQIEEIERNRLEIRVRLADGLRPCPQLFHLGTGGARALPRILGMCDAVVNAEIGDFEARYQISVQTSRTLWARAAGMFRTLFSASSVLQFLEAQQLELHAKHDALQKAHAALAESERRYRAITDTAVDVLCEINEHGRIEYVSASIEDLLGYSPEQVIGSHFSLWVASSFRDLAKKRFDGFAAQPIEEAITWEQIRLHTESGDQIVAELSLRSYRTPEGELRMVGILRDQTHHPRRSRSTSQDFDAQSGRAGLNTLRSTIEDLRGSDLGNPVARSLAVLLAALESKATDLTVADRDEMLAATSRMTRIVESAMTHASDGTTNFRWLETTKLVDGIRLDEIVDRAGVGHDLRIDLTDAPAVVWGEESLFATALGSLIDGLAGEARSPLEFELRILDATGSDPEADPTVVFSVQAISGTPRASESPTLLDSVGELSLAIAKDAATALGGVLILPQVSSPDAIGQLRLPQPKRGD